MRKLWLSGVVVVSLMSLGLGACGDDDKDEAGAVDVTLSDFKIVMTAAVEMIPERLAVRCCPPFRRSCDPDLGSVSTMRKVAEGF